MRIRRSDQQAVADVCRMRRVCQKAPGAPAASPPTICRRGPPPETGPGLTGVSDLLKQLPPPHTCLIVPGLLVQHLSIGLFPSLAASEAASGSLDMLVAVPRA